MTVFLGTLSRRDEAPYTEDDFFGVRMFWTNFALEHYQQILRNIGFELLDVTTTTGPEQHPLVFARKPPLPASTLRDQTISLGIRR